jgi:hypothetical protein
MTTKTTNYLDGRPINRLEAIDFLAANYLDWQIDYLCIRAIWKRALTGCDVSIDELHMITGMETIGGREDF